MKDAMNQVLGNLAGPVDFAFVAMDLAEQLLRARWTGTDGDPEPDGAFAVLRPRSAVFSGRTILLEPHMNEVLDRLIDGQDLRPGTDAECISALSEMSLKRPLGHALYTVYCYLFNRAFPDRAPGLLGKEAVRRSADVETDPVMSQLLDELRHKLRDEDRRL